MQFTKAVEAKQVAQQDAERARFVVLKADQVRPPVICSPSSALCLLPNSFISSGPLHLGLSAAAPYVQAGRMASAGLLACFLL